LGKALLQTIGSERKEQIFFQMYGIIMEEYSFEFMIVYIRLEKKRRDIDLTRLST